MWILPNNYQLSSHYAQGFLASKEDLNLPDLNIESSLTSKSKPMRLPTCLRKWKRDYWFRRLCLATLKPCQWRRFETELTSLHRAIHANPFQQQEKGREKKTQDTSGLISKKSSEQLDLFDASLKTSKDTLALDSEKSLKTWKDSVIARRGEYLVRVKSAQAIRGKEYSSWPTPTVGEEKFRLKGNSQASKCLEAMARRGELDTKTGPLNPEFVEWLMGYETGSTELGSWGTQSYPGQPQKHG